MAYSSASTGFSRRSTESTAGPRIHGFMRAGMLDWPGRVAATVFLGGCNLRCPFCHNPDLVAARRGGEPVDALIEHLRSRSDWLDGVVFTGGEPCIDPHLSDLVTAARATGLPVKLDTNGTCPEVLEHLLSRRLVDFVALDVKATPDRYERATGKRDAWSGVSASIAAVLSSGVAHEFRTTCYPPAVAPDDLVHIAAHLAGASRYVLQQFRPIRTLDPAAASVRPYDADTLRSAAARCCTFVPTVVRGA